MNYSLKSHLKKILSLTLCTSIYAGTPIWTFSPPNPSSILISDNDTPTIQYLVTNASNKPKNLILKPQPGLSASSCYLPNKGSTCTLTVTINGNQTPEEGIHTGPVLCQQANPNQCYQPPPENQLNVNRGGIFTSVGSYDNNGQSVPLSYTSTNYGATWSLSPILPPAQGNSNNDLTSVSCNNAGKCASVGKYRSGSRDIPLSYTSTDYGITWRLSTVLPPAQGSANNTLTSVSCNNSGQCTTVGTYNNGSRVVPLSYTSADSGVTWTLSSVLPPAQGSGNNQLTSVSCNTSNNCTAVGNYNNGSRNVPLSYTSTDSGATWSVSTVLPPAQGSASNSLYGVSCDNSGRCATVGDYNNGSQTTPLSYSSSDYGATWSVSTSLPPPQGDDDNLYSVSCNNVGNCVAVGGYNIGGGQYVPLSYTSADSGVTWSASATQPPFQRDIDDELYGVTCNNAGNCTAVGISVTNTQVLPLSYTSSDYGVTWNVSVILPPQGTDNTFLNGVD